MKIIKKHSLIYIGIILGILSFVFLFSPIFQEEKNDFTSSFKNILNNGLNAEFLYRDVQACYDEKNYQKTIEKAQEFLIKYPKSNKADIILLRLGLSQRYSGKTENALSSLIKLIDDYPKSRNIVISLYYIARIHSENYIDTKEAVKYLNIIIEKYSEDSAEWVQKAKEFKLKIEFPSQWQEAESLFQEEKYQEALEKYQKIINEYPSSEKSGIIARILLRIGDCQKIIGEEEKALLTFQKIITDYTNYEGIRLHFYAYVRIAEIYYEKNEYEKVEEYCNKVLENQSTLPKELIERTEVLKILILKNRTEILFQEAESLFQEEKYQEALEKYQKIINEYPSSEKIDESFKKSGICFMILKNYEEALNMFEKIMNTTKKETILYIDTYFKTAETYFLKGEYEKAEEYCNKVLENSSIAPEDLIKRTNRLLNAIKEK